MPLELAYTPFGRYSAPFIDLSVDGIDGTNPTTELAQIDTGADRTLVPERLVHQLGLVETDRLDFEVAAGQIVVLPIYLLVVTVPGFGSVHVHVAATDGESHILLGRDVLNLYRITLDGPAELLRIE